MARRRWGEEDGSGMAGRWSHGREEYEPCGIGLTSHSLPSAAQDMWGWTFPTPLILFLWVGETIAHHRSTADREGGGERGSRAAEENVRDQRRWVRSRYTNRRWGGSGGVAGGLLGLRGVFFKRKKLRSERQRWQSSRRPAKLPSHHYIRRNTHTTGTITLSPLQFKRQATTFNCGSSLGFVR